MKSMGNCKILASRLAEVIVSVVSLEQPAFVKGSQILENSFMLNEVVAWSKAYRNPLMILKWILRRHLILFLEIIS